MHTHNWRANLVGTRYNDTFTVTNNTVSVDGKGGTNKVIFSDNINDFLITPSTGSYYVDDILTGQNIYITNVQILEFGGGAQVYQEAANVFDPNSTGAVIGTAGDDVFKVTSTWKSVDGEAGNNTAIFAGDISDYTLAASGSGFDVTDTITGQIVHITNISNLGFNSGTELYHPATATFEANSSGEVIGTAGDDVFKIASDWKSVNGEGGNNTAIFAADLSVYAVTQSGGNATALNTITGQSVALTNVQTLEFNGSSKLYVAPPSSKTGTPALSAWNFVQSLGVNTHLGNWTLYENVGVVENSLSYLGIRNVRDGLRSTPDAQAEYQQLAASGVKFDFLIRQDMDLSTFQSQLDAFVSTNPGSLAAIEGPNEVDQEPYVYNGSSTLSADAQLQQALHLAVSADPKLAGIPLFNLTVVQPASYMAVGDVSGAADYANVHAYVWSGSPPSGPVADYIARGQIDAPGRPTVFTETGYSTMLTDPAAVDEVVAAKYTLNTIMDGFKDGVANTYLYELLDEVSDPGNQNTLAHFGLFHNDGTPKVAATALHNLTTVLNDPTPPATTSRLDFTLSGLPSNGNDLLLQKSDGTFDLILWAEPKIWDETTLKEIPAPTVDTTINFSTLQNVNVYDPMIGTTPVSTSTGTQSAVVHLTDHLLIAAISSF